MTLLLVTFLLWAVTVELRLYLLRRALSDRVAFWKRLSREVCDAQDHGTREEYEGCPVCQAD